MTHSTTISVPPSRLAVGTWSHELDRQVGEGDIHASYSADRIGMGEPSRRPFTHDGSRWLCIGIGANLAAEAYRLVHPSAFAGTPTSYTQKVRANDGQDARSDPLGFYHGMAVKCGCESLVLCGPPVRFVPGQELQLTLF